MVRLFISAIFVETKTENMDYLTPDYNNNYCSDCGEYHDEDDFNFYEMVCWTCFESKED